MRTIAIIGLKGDGSSVLLSGPEVPVGDNLRLWASIRTGGSQVPPGVSKAVKLDSDIHTVDTAFLTPQAKTGKDRSK